MRTLFRGCRSAFLDTSSRSISFDLAFIESNWYTSLDFIMGIDVFIVYYFADSNTANICIL
jgi:hypothetical protein